MNEKMARRLSVLSTLLFFVFLLEFCQHLIHEWAGLSPQVRMDEVYLAGFFAGLMLQLWMIQLWHANKIKPWQLMVTTTFAFWTAGQLVHLVGPH